MLGSAYTSVALASYSSTDSGFIKTNSGKVANAAGPFGAGLADVLLEVFGYGAALVPLLGVAFGLKLAGRTLGGMVRVSAGVILAWALLCVGALVAPAVPDAIAPGGVVGQASVDALTSVVGPAGSWITLAGVMIFTGTFVAQVDWERVAAGIVGFFEGLVPRIGAAGAAVGRSAVGGMRSGASAVAGKVKSLSTPRKPTRVARGEEEEEGDEEYDFAFEDRSDPSGDEEWEEEDEDDEELDEDSEEEESDPRPARRPAREEPEPADRPSDRTRPVDRSLAEVEWEHTEAPKGALTRPAPLINEPIEPTPSALPPGHPVAPAPAARSSPAVQPAPRKETQHAQARQHHEKVDSQSGPSAAHHAHARKACASKGQSVRQRHFDQQGPRLQPGHQARMAQTLVERAIQPKQQRRHQGHRQYTQIGADIRPKFFGYFGGPQPQVRKPQSTDANHRCTARDVERLSDRLPHLRFATTPMPFGPNG
jgi:S-DNA-T family DNA segregation ATPase FtsK/SpoIIIE